MFLFCCVTEAKEQEGKLWELGRFTVNVKLPCDLQVKVASTLYVINNAFGNNSVCNIASLSQTNIPNAFVIGGGHILVIEQKISDERSCSRVSKALYLPSSGEAIISQKQVKSGNCDGQIEANAAMYMVSPYLKYNK